MHGMESGKRWRQRTPAMAAGVTEHMWSLREVLMFRVPPWPQPLADEEPRDTADGDAQRMQCVYERSEHAA
jgi:hypothetical protein